MAGFFNRTELPVVRGDVSVPKCGACGLYKTCRSPKMTPRGKGRKEVLIVTHGPTADDDESGRWLSGSTGQLVGAALRANNLNLEEDCWITGALICNSKGESASLKEKILHCRANLLNTIKALNPKVIILLGEMPVKSLLGHLWKEATGPNADWWTGFIIPDSKCNAWICPITHPMMLAAASGAKQKDPVPALHFKQHMKAIGDVIKGGTRPNTKTLAELTEACDVLLDSREAVSAILSFKERRVVAFDYETNCLKPDSDRAKIHSCSISDGKSTIAYPWTGATAKATWEVLSDPSIAKVASNLKFEERWTIAEFGFGVKNWRWDTMLAGHCLDAREGITSIKFQCYVRFGIGDYDSHVKPYLKSSDDTGNGLNRIHECDLEQLLTYNALDSLLEFMVYRHQRKEMGL